MQKSSHLPFTEAEISYGVRVFLRSLRSGGIGPKIQLKPWARVMVAQ